eukprot:gnl/TRDRNA2_/TRDRNA2_198332_c0_seq1.p1 gnl/TRDRNA2_/TRDRNA2_198332_c0~~gnl/TRDRNA2_/TRDRNA2_198332_c0_seq1.p1  ORF type:complete len:155 (-),score=16.31 gnl/TRDRNA2_/TRDRNA2_198332_c0_seq1:45-509(-)
MRYCCCATEENGGAPFPRGVDAGGVEVIPVVSLSRDIVSPPSKPPPGVGGEEKLVLGMRLRDGTRKDFTLWKRPVGLHFNNLSPIVIKTVRPKSHAEEVGFKVGWVIEMINGEDVRKKDFNYSYDLLTTATTNLATDMNDPAVRAPSRSVSPLR